MTTERHERDCSICKHVEREAIEDAFVSWESASKIASTYKLSVRAVYRHARALSLFPKRDRNIRAALARIIERGANVRVTGAVLVQAIAVFSKINAAGLWIDRRETINVNDLFDKMTGQELEAYASKGELPGWFPHTVSGTLEPITEKDGGTK